MKNTLTKIEVLHDAEKYFGLARITNIALQNYIKKGLIKRIDHFHKKGIKGSVAIYPKNTPFFISFHSLPLCSLHFLHSPLLLTS